MDKAKAAVSGFLSRDGKHDTTVHESINPAITKENVTRTQHNETNTAIDREVHQDHYHTSVQPVQDREVLPEQHSHRMAEVEHRNIQHGNDDHVKQRLAAEAAQFKNTRTVGDVQHTEGSGAAVAGEHIHHHVHENIQPVIQKETIQPSVVHTTVPVHEVHQNEAKHHTATQLPAVTMSDFKNQGGHIGGREERTDSFQGEPRNVGGTLGGAGAHGSTSLTEKSGHHHGSTDNYTTSGAQNTRGMGSETATPRTTGTGTGTGTGVATSSNSSTSHGTEKKASLMDKMNPKIDSNGDGKAGFMK